MIKLTLTVSVKNLDVWQIFQHFNQALLFFNDFIELVTQDGKLFFGWSVCDIFGVQEIAVASLAIRRGSSRQTSLLTHTHRNLALSRLGRMVIGVLKTCFFWSFTLRNCNTFLLLDFLNIFVVFILIILFILFIFVLFIFSVILNTFLEKLFVFLNLRFDCFTFRSNRVSFLLLIS